MSILFNNSQTNDATDNDLINEIIDFSNNIQSSSINEKKRSKRTSQDKKNKQEISYDNFFKSNITLESYKIPELKTAAKKFKLFISGTKKSLIARLKDYFNQSKYCIRIQRIFRGYIVKENIKLRGIALYDRKKCTNDTDFVTMENIDEIPFEYFYSYTDESNFTYGFNIVSLIQLIQNKTKIENPYNRRKISKEIIDDIIKIYKINFILFPSFKNENDEYITNRTYRSLNVLRNIGLPVVLPVLQSTNENSTVENQQQPIQSIVSMNYNPQLNHYLMDESHLLRYRMIQETRRRSVNQRINELFMVIDQLGNYTQSSWFSNLDIRALFRLYRCINDIWNYRADLPDTVKNLICPFHGPFDNIFTRNITQVEYTNLTYDEIRMICLIIMENMVYSGVDEEYRKIGCFHALSALTIVSYPARAALPWLYESVMY